MVLLCDQMIYNALQPLFCIHLHLGIYLPKCHILHTQATICNVFPYYLLQHLLLICYLFNQKNKKVSRRSNLIKRKNKKKRVKSQSLLEWCFSNIHYRIQLLGMIHWQPLLLFCVLGIGHIVLSSYYLLQHLLLISYLFNQKRLTYIEQVWL